MSLLFRAATALLFAALITGQPPYQSPGFRTVAADLHRARPQARLEASLIALFHGGQG